MALHCSCGKKCFSPNYSADMKKKRAYEGMTGNTVPNFEIFFSCRVKSECGGLCWWRAESCSHTTTATHWPCMRCSSEGSENQVSSCLYYLYKKNNLSVSVHPVICEDDNWRMEMEMEIHLSCDAASTELTWRLFKLMPQAICIINSALLCLRLQISFGQQCLHVLSVPSDMLPGQPLVFLFCFFSVFNLYPSSFLLQPWFGMLLITVFQRS